MMIARGQALGAPDRAHAPRRWRNSISAKIPDVDAARATLERSEIVQSLIDVGAVAFAIVFASTGGVAVSTSFYILFFVRT